MGAKDGGPAFPGKWDEWKGMSARDYAAIHADMNGLTISRSDVLDFVGIKIDANSTTEEQLRASAAVAAKARYIYADAMLAAREAS